MVTKKIPIIKILTEQLIMPRDQIDADYVNDLVEDLEAGAVFPPVDPFFDGRDYILADGYHRLEAAIKAGHKKIEARVREGDKRAALLFSSGANAKTYCHNCY